MERKIDILPKQTNKLKAAMTVFFLISVNKCVECFCKNCWRQMQTITIVTNIYQTTNKMNNIRAPVCNGNK